MSKRPGDHGYAAGWCIHYRARGEDGGIDILPSTCEAGVEYARFKGANFKATFAQRPCFLTDTGESKPGALFCEHLRRPTPEEIAAHREWMDKRVHMTLTAIGASAEFRKQSKGKNTSQVIDCPVCKVGKLSMVHHACNGHVHGQCSTEGCVSWME